MRFLRYCDFPKVTLLVSGRAELQTQVSDSSPKLQVTVLRSRLPGVWDRFPARVKLKLKMAQAPEVKYAGTNLVYEVSAIFKSQMIISGTSSD